MVKTAAKRKAANKNRGPAKGGSKKTPTNKKSSKTKKAGPPTAKGATKTQSSKGRGNAKAKSAAKNRVPSKPPPKTGAVKLPPKKTSKEKMLSRDFLLDLAQAIRLAAVESIEGGKGAEIVGMTPSGDPTFELDQAAEKALLTFLKKAKTQVAYYSEDAGYTTFTSGTPHHLLVVDPVDGSRAAKCGFESCVVSVASTRVIERPCMSDVDNALIMEISGDRYFYAERDKGTRIHQNGASKKARFKKHSELETMSWAMTVPARPAELIFPTAAKLIDLTSLKGGFFACNSTAYSLTRLLTNQLDASVDFANRYFRDAEEFVRDQFINAGRGVVLGICPYDLAGALLVAQEAGCIVTDAYGNSFDDILLLDNSTSNMRSLIAATNKTLHKKLMSFFDTRIRQYELLLRRSTQSKR